MRSFYYWQLAREAARAGEAAPKFLEYYSRAEMYFAFATIRQAQARRERSLVGVNAGNPARGGANARARAARRRSRSCRVQHLRPL